MIEKIDKLMDAYEGKFGDMFPTMCFQMDSDEEIADKIQQCLDKNTPAEELFDIKDDVWY